MTTSRIKGGPGLMRFLLSQVTPGKKKKKKKEATNSTTGEKRKDHKGIFQEAI